MVWPRTSLPALSVASGWLLGRLPFGLALKVDTGDLAGTLDEAPGPQIVNEAAKADVSAGDFEKKSPWLPDAHIANSKELCGMVASFTLDAAPHHPDLVFYGKKTPRIPP